MCEIIKKISYELISAILFFGIKMLKFPPANTFFFQVFMIFYALAYIAMFY